MVPSVLVRPVSTTVTHKTTMLDPWRTVMVGVIMGAGDRVVITTVGLLLLLPSSLRHKMTTTVAAAAAVVEVTAAEADIKIIHRSSKVGTVAVVVIVAVGVDFEEAGDSLAEGVVVVEAPLHRSSGTTAEVLLRSNGMTVEVLLHLSNGTMVEVLLLSISGMLVEVVAAAEIIMNGNDPGTIVTLGDDRLVFIHSTSKCYS
jgi:hypothetical protein